MPDCQRRRPPSHYIPGLIWLTRKQWDVIVKLVETSTLPETDNTVEVEQLVRAARLDALRSHVLMLKGRERQRYRDRVAGLIDVH